MRSNDRPGILRAMLDAAVSRAQPETCLPPHLPDPPAGRVVVLACGKAGATMSAAVEHHYLDGLGLDPSRLEGLCVTRHGYARPLRRIRCVEAGHPVPDEAGVAATRDTLAAARTLRPSDLALALISGGGSANWSAPAGEITLAEKQALTRALLKSGATIAEINVVRRRISAIKGGRLALAVHPAPLLALAISDVPGDDPSAIASGPTVPSDDPPDAARAVLERYRIVPPPAVAAVLDDPALAPPAPDHPAFASSEFRLVARPADALEAGAEIARGAGYEVAMLGDALEGEARDIAAAHAERAGTLHAQGRRAVLLSGGELTVTVRGNGRGGPNQEYALALARHLNGARGIWAIAADTDGTDGGEGNADDPAGALVTPSTAERAAARSLDPSAHLADNDATGFFEALGDLVRTGPTGTNVNDFRAVLVDDID